MQQLIVAILYILFGPYDGKFSSHARHIEKKKKRKFVASFLTVGRSRGTSRAVWPRRIDRLVSQEPEEDFFFPGPGR